MALDTKEKRGSAIMVSCPFRLWLSEPSGTVGAGGKLSGLYLYAGIEPTPPTPPPPSSGVSVSKFYETHTGLGV